MSQQITIAEREYPVIQFDGKPVITLAMVDQMHGRPADTARRNFKENRSRFETEKHFYLIDYSKKDEFRPFGITIPPRGMIVLTERGYLLLAKSLTDDKAWEVQERLIDSYFSVKEHIADAGKMMQPETVAAAPVPAIEYKPLNPQQQVGLTKAVRARAKEAHTTTLKIYRELRDVFEVASWKEIPADKYTEAKALVKSMVLEGELMPRQTMPMVQPQPEPQYTRIDTITIPASDWFTICNIIRSVNAQVHDRLDNYRYNTIEPQLGVELNRAIGMVYTHTFAAFGVRP